MHLLEKKRKKIRLDGAKWFFGGRNVYVFFCVKENWRWLHSFYGFCHAFVRFGDSKMVFFRFWFRKGSFSIRLGSMCAVQWVCLLSWFKKNTAKIRFDGIEQFCLYASIMFTLLTFWFLIFNFLSLLIVSSNHFKGNRSSRVDRVHSRNNLRSAPITTHSAFLVPMGYLPYPTI